MVEKVWFHVCMSFYFVKAVKWTNVAVLLVCLETERGTIDQSAVAHPCGFFRPASPGRRNQTRQSFVQSQQNIVSLPFNSNKMLAGIQDSPFIITIPFPPFR